MTVIVLGFLATVACGLVGLHGRAGPGAVEAHAASTSGVAIPAVVIALAFGLQLAAVTAAARSQLPFPALFHDLPLVPIDDRAPFFAHSPAGSEVGACVLLQTLAGVALWRAGRRRTFGRVAQTVVATCSAAMVLAALATPALTSFDIYYYVGSAHVPNPYAPPPRAFAGELAVINQINGVPIAPSPYGPVWSLLAGLALRPFPSLAAQLATLRVLGALAFLAGVQAVRALRFPPSEVALMALCPGLIESFVLDAHNDMLPIALVLWASAGVRRAPALAAACAILAGGMKLPFLAIGALAFAGTGTRRGRVLGAVAVAAGGLALSAALGGSRYLGAMRATSHAYRFALAEPSLNVLHGLLALAALAALALAVIAARFWPSASWSFGGLGVAFFGWYVAWGLPYAALERRWFAPFILSLPALTFFLSTVYFVAPLERWALALAEVCAPLAVYLTLRRRRDAFAERGPTGA